jgi:hypothetical protein
VARYSPRPNPDPVYDVVFGYCRVTRNVLHDEEFAVRDGIEQDGDACRRGAMLWSSADDAHGVMVTIATILLDNQVTVENFQMTQPTESAQGSIRGAPAKTTVNVLTKPRPR